ncbi:MAG: type VI secretion system Vgr family protein, partial [Longimicrobiales bacterium]
MPLFTQAGRPLRVTTELGEDGLLLSSFTGREAVSQPYVYALDLLSEDRQIDPARMLRSRVTLHVGLPGGGERQVHGIVRRFVRQERGEQLNAYHAEIVPWLWFLSLSHDCRIFQNVTVPEIIETVFGDLGYTDYENRCTGSYQKREYCVMYRESHLDFVSRLMEEEGIYYHFEHETRKHTLVLVDAPVNLKDVPGSADAHMAGQGAPHEDLVVGLQEEHSVYIARVALKSNDYLQPSLTLYETVSGESPGKEEVYDYPGKYTDTETGQRYARLRLGAAEALRHVVRGHGTMRSFIAGHKFDLQDHHILDANQTYVLLEVQHTGSVGDFIAGGGGGARAEYSNQFVALPYRIPYLPQPATGKPIVRGSQTALVVGPSGEEIHTDKHGRVKVQFHWDRQGKKDEKSSCWVRVSSGWAGKGWGAVSLPRIGQEVIIDFLEGDPDRPIITGRVYNAEQVPPYTLPGNQTQSG